MGTKWMYLENIFVGSDDIQKKLPTEANLFNQINMNWTQSIHSFDCSVRSSFQECGGGVWLQNSSGGANKISKPEPRLKVLMGIW